MAVPGFVYGGLIASLIDCHAMGTAAAATLQAAGQEVGAVPSPRFVTAALRVDYLRPTPLGPELVIRARVRQATERKVVIDATLSVENVVTAHAEAVAVRMPPTMA
jgi:acyl-coenzyme A thioesterase PaaI-like protein